MNFKLSKKDVLKQASKVIAVGYCEIQTLLHLSQGYGVELIGHNEGIYGWNCDLYIVDTPAHLRYNNIIIATGYRPFGTPANKDILKEVEQTAKVLRDFYLDKKISYDAFNVQLDRLIDKVVGK